ncbi:MAG: HNH endonuclease [Anaerolineales bacterium]
MCRNRKQPANAETSAETLLVPGLRFGSGYRRKFCTAHSTRATATDYTTLADIRRRATYQANARIRQMARRAYRQYGLPLQCQVCGYSTHVEVCHKHGISEFPGNTLVSEVNSRANLVCLCPNHHWEFDHGFLSL